MKSKSYIQIVKENTNIQSVTVSNKSVLVIGSNIREYRYKNKEVALEVARKVSFFKGF